MNELLLWISARRSGTAQGFRAKAAQLGVLRTGGAAWRAAQWNLEKLAHAEFSAAASGHAWRVAPPVLAAGKVRSDGSIRAVLCGARTPAMVERLRAAVSEVELTTREQPEGPDLVQVVAPSSGDLERLAASAGVRVQPNAPLALLCWATPPKRAQLQSASIPLGGWTASEFSKPALQWRPASPRAAREARSGLFRFRSDYETVHILIKDGAAWACDPAAAKYRILRPRNRVLAYSAADRVLSVRATCRPPALVERALVLCSGLLPEYRDGVLLYCEVDREVAQAAASVLGQRIDS